MNAHVPDIRISQPAIQTEVPVRESPARSWSCSGRELSAIRKFLLSRGNSALADRLFHWLMVLCALSIFAIVGLIAWRLVVSSQLTWEQFGLGFFYKTFIDPVTGQPLYWDPVNEHFSALPFIYGTLVSSFLALLICGSAGRRVWPSSSPRCAPRRCAGRSRFSPSCWPPFPASSTDCGRCLCWCRCCASM